jgi:hypothetical protein
VVRPLEQDGCAVTAVQYPFISFTDDQMPKKEGHDINLVGSHRLAAWIRGAERQICLRIA